MTSTAVITRHLVLMLFLLSSLAVIATPVLADTMAVSDKYAHEEILLPTDDMDVYTFNLGAGEEVVFSFTVLRGPDIWVYLVDGPATDYSTKAVDDVSTSSPETVWSGTYEGTGEKNIVVIASNRTLEVTYRVNIKVQRIEIDLFSPWTVLAVIGIIFFIIAVIFLLYMIFRYKQPEQTHRKGLIEEQEDVIELGNSPRGTVDPYKKKGRRR